MNEFQDIVGIDYKKFRYCLRISRNYFYCQKLQLLTYIFAADSMGICSLLFTELCLKVEPSEPKTASAKTEFYMI